MKSLNILKQYGYNCCVETKFSDGMIAIDTIEPENEVARNMD